jgi:hypothetical protein
MGEGGRTVDYHLLGPRVRLTPTRNAVNAAQGSVESLQRLSAFVAEMQKEHPFPVIPPALIEHIGRVTGSASASCQALAAVFARQGF